MRASTERLGDTISKAESACYSFELSGVSTCCIKRAAGVDIELPSLVTLKHFESRKLLSNFGGYAPAGETIVLMRTSEKAYVAKTKVIALCRNG